MADRFNEIHVKKRDNFFKMLLKHEGWEPDLEWEYSSPFMSPFTTEYGINYDFSPSFDLKELIDALIDCKDIRSIWFKSHIEVKIKYGDFSIVIEIYDLDGSPDTLIDTIKINNTLNGKTFTNDYKNFLILIKETIEKYKTSVYESLMNEELYGDDDEPINIDELTSPTKMEQRQTIYDITSPFSPGEDFWNW